jgi:hypothetical protein
MEQIMEMLNADQGMLTGMDAKLEEAETNRKAEREALKEMTARMETNQAELKSAIAQIEWKKPASVEMKPEAAHEDWKTPQECRLENRRKGVGTDIWTQGIAGNNRNGPRKRMGAERTWLQPAQGRPVVQRWDDLSCSDGTTQENFFHKGHDPEIS